MRACRILIAVLTVACAAGVEAQIPQLPQFPGVPGGLPPGLDCNMILGMINKMGLPPEMQAMISRMCAADRSAAPNPGTPVPPAAPASSANVRCEMFTDLSYQMPQLWLGPMPVINARDLETADCRLAPANQQLVLGLRYFGDGRLPQAATAFREAAERAGEPALRLRALAELAKTHLAAGRAAEARPVIEQGLAQTAPGTATGAPPRTLPGREDIERERTVLRAEFMILLGIALEQGNDLAGAIARYREADALTRNTQPPGMPADPMSEIAKPYLSAVLIRTGQHAEARSILQRMVREREYTVGMASAGSVMDEAFGKLPFPLPVPMPRIGSRMNAFAIYSGDLFLPPYACAALAGIELEAQANERALEAVEQCRGRALASLLGNRAFHAPERAALPTMREIEDYARNRKIPRDRAQQELIEQRITNPRARAAARPATMAEIRAMASERNATLIVYQIDYTPNLLPVRMPDRETGITAWVVSPNGSVSVRRRALGGQFGPGTLPLSGSAMRLREDMEVPERGGSVAAVRVAAGSQGSADLKRFYQLLIEPLHDLLPAQEGARLIIVPERALFLVPFAALENASGEPLIARHAISVVPSLQTLALASLRKQQPADAASSVVVGNPQMPQYAPRPGARTLDMPPLPGAEEEARAVAALLKTTALTGAAATKSAVLARVANARYVHLATHGFLNRHTEMAQSGVNPHVRDVALFDETADGGIKTPGMLALAPAAGDSGMLSADEIANATTRADLVVMSACDSGRGAINDDGVIGLSRAWMAAGAPSVMVTLWQIPDDATKDLMIAFYEQLASGARKAEALRNAMLATRRKFPAPFNWAAFTLIGEPD